MSIFELTESLGIFLLSLEQIFIPLLVEFLILFDVCLLTLLSLLGLIEDELIILSLVILLFQLCDSVTCHFSLNILASCFALVSVLSQDINEVFDIASIDLAIESVLNHSCFHLVLFVLFVNYKVYLF